MHYIPVIISTYDPTNGFNKYIDIQAQPDDDEIFINIEESTDDSKS